MWGRVRRRAGRRPGEEGVRPQTGVPVLVVGAFKIPEKEQARFPHPYPELTLVILISEFQAEFSDNFC